MIHIPNETLAKIARELGGGDTIIYKGETDYDLCFGRGIKLIIRNGIIVKAVKPRNPRYLDNE